MTVKIYAIKIFLKSQEPFQSYLLTGQDDSAIIFISKLVSVEMACLLGIQNEIQAVCEGLNQTNLKWLCRSTW